MSQWYYCDPQRRDKKCIVVRKAPQDKRREAPDTFDPESFDLSKYREVKRWMPDLKKHDDLYRRWYHTQSDCDKYCQNPIPTTQRALGTADIVRSLEEMTGRKGCGKATVIQVRSCSIASILRKVTRVCGML